MFESSIRVEDYELFTIMFERKEIRTMLNELLDEALNRRMERSYEKQTIEEDARAKRSLEMKEGSNGGQGRPRKKVTNKES